MRLGDTQSVRSLARLPLLDINMVDDEGRTSLIFACIGGSKGCLQVLLKSGALIHLADFSSRTALHWAANYGRVKLIDTLLESGASIMDEDYQGRTALHLACLAESPSTLEKLLKALKVESQVDCLDDDRMSPLMWSCICGHSKHLQLLLKFQANPLLQDVEGKTALHWCATNKHSDCFRVLLEHSPKIALDQDNYGRTALHLASGEGNANFIYFLLTQNSYNVSKNHQLYAAAINTRDNMKRTPLHWAAGKLSLFSNSNSASQSVWQGGGGENYVRLWCQTQHSR